MANINDVKQVFTDIANATRSKTGSSADLKPTQMASAISGIPTGINPVSFWEERQNVWLGSNTYSYMFASSILTTNLTSTNYISNSIVSLVGLLSDSDVENILNLKPSSYILSLECDSMFAGQVKITTIPLFTSNINSALSMFSNCFNLKNVPAFNMSNIDGSYGREMRYIFEHCFNLETINMTHIRANLNISSSTKFTRDALVVILNNLDNVGTTKTLTMGSTNLNKLSADDQAIATNKGWTLA